MSTTWRGNKPLVCMTSRGRGHPGGDGSSEIHTTRRYISGVVVMGITTASNGCFGLSLSYQSRCQYYLSKRHSIHTYDRHWGRLQEYPGPPAPMESSKAVGDSINVWINGSRSRPDLDLSLCPVHPFVAVLPTSTTKPHLSVRGPACAAV